MIYENVHRGIFLSRPNRFIANVIINGNEEVCHVKNTGRCRELLLPGTEVYLQHCPSPGRRTQWDLITVRSGERLINIDSQAPNKAFYEWAVDGSFLPKLESIRPEQRYGKSRLDFGFTAGGKEGFAEVKGVTLLSGDKALFPDAPTQRGARHLQELSRCVKDGFEAWAVFVIQTNGVSSFSPNRATDPAFAAALTDAKAAGVTILALGCDVTENSMVIRQKIPIIM